MNSINKITIINILSTFILQGIALISTPIFSRILGVEQFGLYSLFYSWVLIMTCVMGLNISASIGTGIYTFEDKYKEFRSSILVLVLLLGTFELLPILIFKKFISSITGLNSITVLLIGITSFGHAIVNFAQTCFIYEKKAVSNFILSSTVALSTVVISVVLIKVAPADSRYVARMIGMMLPYCVVAVIVVFLMFRAKPKVCKLEYWKYGVVVGVPILFHSLSQIVLGQSDRVMMQMMDIPTREIGIYSLFYTLTAVLSTILGALNNSWCPFYYDDIRNEDWMKIERKSKYYIELFTVLCIGFLLLSREVSYVMADSSYWDGINIIPILAVAVYFTFMYQFPVNFEFFHRKTSIIAIGTLCAGLLNIGLNALLIPFYGMYGAALATAVSYLGLYIAHFIIVNHLKNLTYHLNMKIFIPGFCALMCGIIVFYLLKSFWYIRWGLGIVLGGFELVRIFKRKSIF